MKISESKHPRYPWRVKWREGKVKKNRFFETEKAALRFATRKRAEVQDIAPSDIPPTADERRAIHEARQHAVPLMEAVHLWRKVIGASAGITVADIVKARLEVAKKTVTPLHYRGVKQKLQMLLDAHGKEAAAGVTAKDIAALMAEGKSLHAQRHTRNIISSAFTHAIQIGWLTVNPASKLKPVGAKAAMEPPAIFTPADARRWLSLIAAKAAPCLAGWAVALFAGLRSAELHRLDWREVKLDRKHIEVTAGKSKTKTRRLVDIQPNLLRILKPLAQTHGPVYPQHPRRMLVWVTKEYGGWPPKNAARHSFVSYHLALFGDVAKTELQAGHDRSVLFAHYRELVTKAEAKEYFAITPEE